MQNMVITFFEGEDSMYVRFSDAPIAYGKNLDDARHLDFDKDKRLVGIEFLYVSDGVDLNDLACNQKQLDALTRALAQRKVKVLA